MRDPWLIIAKLEHRRGIGTTYVVPIRGVILDEKIPKLKYDGSILVYKWEVLVEANHNYLTRDIHNMPVCHKDIIYHIDFVYAIFLDFFNRKLEDFPNDLVGLTFARNVLKDLVLDMILLHTEIIFTVISKRGVLCNVEAHEK